MSEKRFGYGETDLFEWVEEDGKMISTRECVNKLNEQQSFIQSLKEENEQLKKQKSIVDKFLYVRECECESLKEENEQLRQKLDFYLLDEFEWKEKYGDCDLNE